MGICEKYQFRRIVNAIGTPTIVGANIVAPQVISAAGEAMAMNVEIDTLQKAASRLIARITGAEAGCVTSSASSGIAISVAATMTGADLARIVQLPDSQELRYEVLLQFGHDVNFGARISQMVRLSGAQVVHLGTANHADAFHLRGAIGPRTAALLYIANTAVHPKGDFISLDQCVELASPQGIPVIVDAAAEPDVRPFLQSGADLVIASGHKAMGAPTSGLICGRKDLVRACYLQNWGIGRAMKVGKEGIVGLMAAMERWYERDAEAESRRYEQITALLEQQLTVRRSGKAHQIEVELRSPNGELSARTVANLLREGDPPIWVHEAIDESERRGLILDLRVLSAADVKIIAEKIAGILANPSLPHENVPYHDLYWSEKRLLNWPD